MDETRARATRVPARDSNFDNPSKPPLDRGGLVGRELLTNAHKIKIPKIQKDLGDFAVWTRLELATSCVTGRHSNQLNYHTVCLFASAKVIHFSQSANSQTIFLHFFCIFRYRRLTLSTNSTASGDNVSVRSRHTPLSVRRLRRRSIDC